MRDFLDIAVAVDAGKLAVYRIPVEAAIDIIISQRAVRGIAPQTLILVAQQAILRISGH